MASSDIAEIYDDLPPMTRNEAARYIGCTTRYIDMLWRDPATGFPAPFYIGRQLRFPRAEIRAWVASRRARKAPACERGGEGASVNDAHGVRERARLQGGGQ